MLDSFLFLSRCRGIKVEKRRIDLLEGAECFFSPNLTTKSLKMAASFDQLKDRIPHMLSAREDFLEQQRQILIKVQSSALCDELGCARLF